MSEPAAQGADPPPDSLDPDIEVWQDGRDGTQHHPSEASGGDVRDTTRGHGTRQIGRTGVVRRLTSVADDVSLVLVVAPRGYGKTTAVRQWARRTRGRVAWVSVTPGHGNRHRFVQDLALAALGAGSTGAALGQLAASPGRLPPGGAAGPIASAAAGAPVTFVLDDLHLLRSQAGLDLVLAVALRLPAGSRVVAIADRQPRLEVGRLRREGRCLDLGPDDLAFSRQETEALLGAAGLHLDADAVDDLQQRTEGWPAGVHLTTLALATSRGEAGDVRTVVGANRYVADYLRDEVLSSLSVDTVRFLMRTAVLEHLCAPLCDAALRSTGSVAWIDEVRTLGLYLVPLDERGEWFRYLRLFAETLRGELRRREPGEDLRILREAALWYEGQGMPEEAIRHAVAGADQLLAARLITAYTPELIGRGRILQVRQWLESLDPEILELHPPLAVTAVWIWGLSGHAGLARRALRVAERSRFEGATPDASAAFVSATAVARTALAPDGVDGMLAEASRYAALGSGSSWGVVAQLLEGVALLLAGSTAAANASLDRAARWDQDWERPGASFALGLRSLTAAAAADWATAAACADEARRLVDGELGGSMTSITAYAASAQVALHRRRTQQARHYVREAERLYREPSPGAFPWLAVHIAIILGRIHLALGDVTAAEHKLTEARRALALLPTQGVLRSQLDDYAAQLDVAGEGGPEDVVGLTSAELRVLRLLPTHHTLSEIGVQLLVSRNTVKSQVAAIYRKLEAANRSAAVRRAQEQGLLKRSDSRQDSGLPQQRPHQP